MTARPIRYQRQVSDRKGKIFYTSITSLSHIRKNNRLILHLAVPAGILILLNYNTSTSSILKFSSFPAIS